MVLPWIGVGGEDGLAKRTRAAIERVGHGIGLAGAEDVLEILDTSENPRGLAAWQDGGGRCGISTVIQRIETVLTVVYAEHERLIREHEDVVARAGVDFRIG